jgi:hypothetical protein
VNARRQARAERAHDMYQAYLRGMSLSQVGALYGIGGERVRQLFFMERLPTRKRGWRPPLPSQAKRDAAAGAWLGRTGPAQRE